MDDDLGGLDSEDFPFDAPPEGVGPGEENELSQFTFKGEWEKVVDLYKTKAWVQRSVITSSKDTALHVAISDDREEVVEKLVRAIVDNHNKKALKMKNNRGETPLHRAATRKSVKMCQCIVEAGQSMGLDLLSITNKWGETPVFTAALHNRKPAFIFLHRAAIETSLEDPDKPFKFLRRTGGAGDTALHSAIRREHFGEHHHPHKYIFS